jgi:uncharacterized protein YkwD
MHLLAILLPLIFVQYTEDELNLFAEANKYRQRHHLRKLVLDDALSSKAKSHCINLNKYHSIHSGISMHDWFDEKQRKWVVIYENEIAHGHDIYDCNAKCAIRAWIKSRPHRKALKSRASKKMGLAIYKKYAIIIFH